MSGPESQDDAVDIELRPAAEVARRCIIHLAIMQRIGLESDPLALTSSDPEAAAFDTREWLRAEGLWDDLTRGEAALLARPLETNGLPMRQEIAMEAEALAAQAWSLGLLETLSDDDYTDVAPLLSLVPTPWAKIAPWASAQSLRPEPVIARRREQAEIWEWRLSIEFLRRELEGRELMDLERTIKDVTRDGVMQGLLKPGKKGGFSIDGQPLTRLDLFDVGDFHVIAQERLISLNWVCGYGESWDDVPLEI